MTYNKWCYCKHSETKFNNDVVLWCNKHDARIFDGDGNKQDKQPEKKQPFVQKQQPANQPKSMVQEAVALGGTVKNTLTVETAESHDWESMTTGELAGRLNEYTKRLKANPKDEYTLNKFNEAKFWLEKKNEK